MEELTKLVAVAAPAAAAARPYVTPAFKAFSKLWDKWAARSKTARYERDKKAAFRELLKGDGADLRFVAALLEQSRRLDDNSPDVQDIRRLYSVTTAKKSAGKSGAKKSATKTGGAKKSTGRRGAKHSTGRKMTASSKCGTRR